jgi:hypothetical protein
MNYKLSLVIERRFNANASPDWPKPLKQWGAFGSPLIQSFGCSMAHAGPDSARKTNTQVYFLFAKVINERIEHARENVYFRFEKGKIKRIALAASLSFRAPLWLTARYARLCLEHECITCTGNK